MKYVIVLTFGNILLFIFTEAEKIEDSEIHRDISFRGEYFVCILVNLKQELTVLYMFLADQKEMRKFCRGPSKHHSCNTWLK
jgi:hypothetical protein